MAFGIGGRIVSLKSRLNSRGPTQWERWLTLLAAGASIAGGGAAFTRTATGSSLLLAIWLCAQSALCFVALVVVDRKLGRKARVADAAQEYHRAFDLLRDCAYHITEGRPPDTYLPVLIQSLGALATAFSTVTAVPVRVCVKDAMFDGDGKPRRLQPGERPDVRDIYVSTLCRSGGPQQADLHQGRDWVSENTDFLELFETAGDYFLSNRLPQDPPHYCNSHFTKDMASKGDYSYRSTIVWPVRRVTYDDERQRRDDLVAFLCADAKPQGVFDRHVDVQLGAAYADSLYTVLRLVQPSSTRET